MNVFGRVNFKFNYDQIIKICPKNYVWNFTNNFDERNFNCFCEQLKEYFYSYIFEKLKENKIIVSLTKEKFKQLNSNIKINTHMENLELFIPTNLDEETFNNLKKNDDRPKFYYTI